MSQHDLLGGRTHSEEAEREKSRKSIIPFSNRDLLGIHNPTNDDVVSMMIAKYDVRMILVDSGVLLMFSFIMLLLMNLLLSHLRPISISLVSFTGDSIRVEGDITLPVIIETPPR